MSSLNARSHALRPAPAADAERTSLFKEDRPRRIDRYISFFGDGHSDADDVCGEELLDSLDVERWPEQ